MNIRKKSVKMLYEGTKKNGSFPTPVEKADFSDFKAFLKTFLNTSEQCRRKEIAEEFRKRHLELYEFLKENREIISAETEISKTINDVLSGNTVGSEDRHLSNLFEIIEDGLKK